MYNLLTQEWIPVLHVDGTWKRVGLLEVLTDAHRIRTIAASNPMDRFAVLRFLLAILYWCRGNPSEADRQVTAFPEEWFVKLEEHSGCFDLLGSGKRFYQDATAARTRTVTDLLQEIPTGNNFWHFRHSTDEADGLCLECCASALLRLPLYCVSGLPDLKSGINGSPPVYVMPIEDTLLTTLMANWAPSEALGEPAWAASTHPTEPGKPVPLLVGLTALARRLWLHDPVSKNRPCISCGRHSSLVVHCEYQSAGSLENANWNDPHVLYRDGSPRKSERASDLSSAGNFRMDRPWPQPVQRLLSRVGAAGGRRYWMVGFATDKAKNVDVWERVVALPEFAAIAEPPWSVEQWDRQGNRLPDKLRPRSRQRGKRIPIELKSTIMSIRPQVEHNVFQRVGDLLTGGEKAWQNAADEYRPLLRFVASSLAPDFTVQDAERRRSIRYAVPSIVKPAIDADKPKRKRGGNRT